MKQFIKIFITVILLGLFYYGLNSYMGWYGHKPWRLRRSTGGDKKESVQRGVFVKDLYYESSLPLKDFHVYIEKGYTCGYFSVNETRVITNSKYNYQASYTIRDTLNQLQYDLINYKCFDSVYHKVYLKKPRLNTSMIFMVSKYENKKWDSIGYIKVWDK